MHVITVDFRINQGDEARFLERVRQQARDSLANEAGCHQFDVCLDPDDPGHVFLYELYSDEAAFQAHLEAAHFKDFDRTVTPWVAEKRATAWRRDG
jgi:quinol monooxygenase YgiN